MMKEVRKLIAEMVFTEVEEKCLAAYRRWAGRKGIPIDELLWGDWVANHSWEPDVFIVHSERHVDLARYRVVDLPDGNIRLTRLLHGKLA